MVELRQRSGRLGHWSRCLRGCESEYSHARRSRLSIPWRSLDAAERRGRKPRNRRCEGRLVRCLRRARISSVPLGCMRPSRLTASGRGDTGQAQSIGLFG